jgi:hypothetical protein
MDRRDVKKRPLRTLSIRLRIPHTPLKTWTSPPAGSACAEITVAQATNSPNPSPPHPMARTTSQIYPATRFTGLLTGFQCTMLSLLLRVHRASYWQSSVHNPLRLIEPTRVVFGEMNVGTVACSQIPAKLRTLPKKMRTFAPPPMSMTTRKGPTPSRNSLQAGTITWNYV